MNRKDKIALLTSLMHGDPGPLVRYGQQSEADKILIAFASRSKSSDLVSGISLNGQSVVSMSNGQYEQWKGQLGAKGALVISFIRRERRQ